MNWTSSDTALTSPLGRGQAGGRSRPLHLRFHGPGGYPYRKTGMLGYKKDLAV